MNHMVIASDSDGARLGLFDKPSKSRLDDSDLISFGVLKFQVL